MTDVWRGMILAAGFGKRLYPLTQWMPKPLVPVSSKPLLYHLIRNLEATRVDELAVNSHHQGNRIAEFLDSQKFKGNSIQQFHETVILDTGGALKNAAPFLEQSDHFLVHNGDILSDLDLEKLMDDHVRSGAFVTLAVRKEGAKNLLLDAEGAVLDIRGLLNAPEAEGTRRVSFMGVAAYSKEFLDWLPAGASDVVEAWAELIRHNKGTVRTVSMDTSFWSDLGTFESFFKAQRDIIDEQRLQLEPQAQVLVEQGSNRRYYRLGSQRESLVLMLSQTKDDDFDRFIDTSAFLNGLQLRNPRLWAWSADTSSALLEDLGDDTLYRLFHQGDQKRQKEIYTKTIRYLVEFQTKATAYRHKCHASCDRALDKSHLRWESQYFAKEFLEQYLGMDLSGIPGLNQEFEFLAEEVQAHHQVIIHRDFQSQNIMIKEGEVHIVDYQGMRTGSCFYDFVSLVNDPYVELPEGLKADLQEVFLNLLEKQGIEVNGGDRQILSAGMQRNMQALGAYAFLSQKKGKSSFLAFMQPGCRILLRGVEKWNQRFPDERLEALQDVVERALKQLVCS